MKTKLVEDIFTTQHRLFFQIYLNSLSYQTFIFQKKRWAGLDEIK